VSLNFAVYIDLLTCGSVLIKRHYLLLRVHKRGTQDAK